MIGLCRKEILNHKMYVLLITILNFIYGSIHLLSAKKFQDIMWKMEIIYLILLGLIIPILLYVRYGDVNRSIIKNVIYTKLRRTQSYAYQVLYLLWFFIGIAVSGSIMQLLCSVSTNYNVQRGLLFLGNALVVSLIYTLLFLFLINLTDKYLWAIVLYLLCFFGLLLLHAPESILYFYYVDGNPMYGTSGKLILIALLVLLNIALKSIRAIGNNLDYGHKN